MFCILERITRIQLWDTKSAESYGWLKSLSDKYNKMVTFENLPKFIRNVFAF